MLSVIDLPGLDSVSCRQELPLDGRKISMKGAVVGDNTHNGGMN